MTEQTLRVLMVQRFDLCNVACARRIIAMAREMLRRGHEITLVNFPHQTRQSEIPALHSLSELDGADVVNLPRGGLSLLSNIRRISLLARGKDVVHLWKSYPDGALPALWGSYLRDLPIHYDWDDWEEGIASEITGSLLVRSLTRRWEQSVLGYVDTLSTASEALKQRALELGFPPDRIFDAPVGAECGPSSSSKRVCDCERLRLVYVGQLEVAAYAEEAIQSFGMLRRVRPQAHLTIVGGGRYLPMLQELAQEKGLGDGVRFTGYRPAAEVAEFLAQSDVGLAPFADTQVTRAKSPLKVVEYLAAGLPVVGSCVGEVPRMVGDAGRTVAPGDRDAFAQAILELVASPETWQMFSRAARKRVQDVYNWSRTTESILDAYKAAITGRK